VTAGGTAYPLTVADGTLYLGANHFVKKMTMYENLLVVDEEALVEYDTDGNATYFLHSDYHDVDADENGQVEDDSVLNNFYDEMFEGEMIVFTKVQ
nr:hypothetical protein [Butyrivibrio sp.]